MCRARGHGQAWSEGRRSFCAEFASDFLDKRRRCGRLKVQQVLLSTGEQLLGFTIFGDVGSVGERLGLWSSPKALWQLVGVMSDYPTSP